MKRYLLDTCAMGDFVNRRRGVHERARAARVEGARLGTCMPVLGELFFGIEFSKTRDENRDRLIRAIAGLSIWPYTREAADEYGRIAAELRRAGRSMQQVDIQVAAIARTLSQCTVVSEDSDLFAVPGLSVVNWASQGPDH
jgi:tRNA(fMet)-specific endonuclease VapC